MLQCCTALIKFCWSIKRHDYSFVSQKRIILTMFLKKYKNVHKFLISTVVDFKTHYVIRLILRTCNITLISVQHIDTPTCYKTLIFVCFGFFLNFLLFGSVSLKFSLLRICFAVNITIATFEQYFRITQFYIKMKIW